MLQLHMLLNIHRIVIVATNKILLDILKRIKFTIHVTWVPLAIFIGIYTRNFFSGIIVFITISIINYLIIPFLISFLRK